MENIIKENKEKKEKTKELFQNINANSTIIKDKKDIYFLEERLRKNYPYIKNITYELLYRATKDGNSAESFHQKCDNIKGTLILVKTTKGLRFGGYTESKWEKQNGANKKDKNGIGFCYSLDLKKIYNNSNDAKSTIRCYANEGPTFYGGDAYMLEIYFPIDSNSKSNTGYSKSHKSFGNFERDYEINNGESKFLIKN